MTTTSIEDDKLKDLFKTALIELFEERRDVVRELIAEALEDVALVRAIDEGEKTARVSRDEVFELLEGGR